MSELHPPSLRFDQLIEERLGANLDAAFSQGGYSAYVAAKYQKTLPKRKNVEAVLRQYNISEDVDLGTVSTIVDQMSQLDDETFFDNCRNIKTLQSDLDDLRFVANGVLAYDDTIAQGIDSTNPNFLGRLLIDDLAGDRPTNLPRAYPYTVMMHKRDKGESTDLVSLDELTPGADTFDELQASAAAYCFLHQASAVLVLNEAVHKLAYARFGPDIITGGAMIDTPGVVSFADLERYTKAPSPALATFLANRNYIPDYGNGLSLIGAREIAEKLIPVGQSELIDAYRENKMDLLGVEDENISKYLFQSEMYKYLKVLYEEHPYHIHPKAEDKIRLFAAYALTGKGYKVSYAEPMVSEDARVDRTLAESVSTLRRIAYIESIDLTPLFGEIERRLMTNPTNPTQAAETLDNIVDQVDGQPKEVLLEHLAKQDEFTRWIVTEALLIVSSVDDDGKYIDGDAGNLLVDSDELRRQTRDQRDFTSIRGSKTIRNPIAHRIVAAYLRSFAP